MSSRAFLWGCKSWNARQRLQEYRVLLVGDWLLGPIQKVGSGDYSLDKAQKGYAQFLDDLFDSVTGAGADGEARLLSIGNISFDNFMERYFQDILLQFHYPSDAVCRC